MINLARQVYENGYPRYIDTIKDATVKEYLEYLNKYCELGCVICVVSDKEEEIKLLHALLFFTRVYIPQSLYVHFNVCPSQKLELQKTFGDDNYFFLVW